MDTIILYHFFSLESGAHELLPDVYLRLDEIWVVTRCHS